MKLTISKNSIINIYFSLFLLALLYKLTISISTGYPKESWEITEFLINYQGGFVRRGLLGEIILRLYYFSGLSPYVIIITISLLSYVVLIIIYVKLFFIKGYTLILLPFVFFLGNPIINNFWVRKDTLLILIFIALVSLTKKKGIAYVILINILLIVGLLIHEAIFFFSIPIVLLLLYPKDQYPKRFLAIIHGFVVSATKILPSLIAFFLVVYNKGSHEISRIIWYSWKNINFPMQSEFDMPPPAAINGISLTLNQGLLYTKHTLKNFNDGIYAPLAWFIILLIIYYITTNATMLNFKIYNYTPRKSFNKLNISVILIFQFFSVLPLFLLGWDYSRWIFFWITSSFAIYLIVPEERRAFLFPNLLTKFARGTNLLISFFLKNSYVLIFCLLIGFPRFSWYFAGYRDSNSFIIVIQFVSKIIQHIIQFILKIIQHFIL